MLDIHDIAYDLTMLQLKLKFDSASNSDMAEAYVRLRKEFTDELRKSVSMDGDFK